MRIGGKPARTGRIPHNQGLARRADRVIDGLADVKASQFQTSLMVDGVVAAVWSRESGAVACSCRTTTESVTDLIDSGTIIDSDSIPVSTQVSNSAQDSADISRSTSSFSDNDGSGSYTYVGNQHTRSGLDALFADTYDMDIVSRIQPSDEDIEGIIEATGEDPSGLDLIEALDIDNDGSIDTGDADGDPLLQVLEAGGGITSDTQPFSPSMINCPICFDSGRMDAWRIYGGERIILDLSTRYTVVSHNFDLPEDGPLPQQIEIWQDGHFTWTSVSFPRMWENLVRMVVFDRGRVVSAVEYVLEYSTPANPNVFTELTYAALSNMNNGSVLKTSNKLNIRISPRWDDSLFFTHIEILILTTDLPRIQVPEITVPNDSEFADWNLSATFEVSANARIKATSIISEAKYNRVWKVTSLNRKLTASGKSSGYQVDCRAIHSFERQYLLANIFGRPIDPYALALAVDDEMDEDL